ncbi:MAG: ubiG 2 [Acidobacteria bacterium]|nr:ubiG 2 [Acidobacteriota bacterium]
MSAAGLASTSCGSHGEAPTGVDIADSAIALARENLRHQSLPASLCVGDGERLPFPGGTFDFVYAHGVVQYTSCDRALVEECRRVLKPGGTAFFQVYNRVSWLNALSRVMKVGLEHQDAPVIKKYSPGEFRGLLGGFANVRVVFERFPVKSRLHGGWKGALYNRVFVGAFNAIPKPLVRRFGWHLLAFCRK